MLLTSISCPVCPSTGLIVSSNELLANAAAAVVTLIQSDHPAGRGILSHSFAHPSFRPMLCISPSPFVGRWLKITDAALREPLHHIHLALPTHPQHEVSRTVGVLRTIPSASRRAHCLFWCRDTESGRKGEGEQISLFRIKNKSREFKNYKMRLNSKLKTRTPVGRTGCEWHRQYHTLCLSFTY